MLNVVMILQKPADDEEDEEEEEKPKKKKAPAKPRAKVPKSSCTVAS
jgi:hypothetical protein